MLTLAPPPEVIRAALIQINLALNLLPQGQRPRNYLSDQALTIIGDLPTQVPPPPTRPAHAYGRGAVIRSSTEQ